MQEHLEKCFDLSTAQNNPFCGHLTQCVPPTRQRTVLNDTTNNHLRFCGAGFRAEMMVGGGWNGSISPPSPMVNNVATFSLEANDWSSPPLLTIIPPMSMDDLLSEVPEDMHDFFKKLVALTDTFCDAHLNADYKQVCRDMAMAMCQKNSPITKGEVEGWASGIVWAAGWVNFLTDPEQKPHMTGKDVAKGFGVSVATMQAKSSMVKAGLELQPCDPDFTLPSMMQDNPLIWMAELSNGIIVDLRSAPKAVQVEAFKRGLIPFVPADQAEKE